jgi:hypothetical protein
MKQRAGSLDRSQLSPISAPHTKGAVDQSSLAILVDANRRLFC